MLLMNKVERLENMKQQRWRSHYHETHTALPAQANGFGRKLGRKLGLLVAYNRQNLNKNTTTQLNRQDLSLSDCWQHIFGVFLAEDINISCI